jgi:hypothetical protein
MPPDPSMARPPIVFVVQDDPRRNMTSAMDFGLLEGLLEADEEANMLNIPKIVTKIRYGLRHMQPTDYLLCSGNPIAIGIAFAVAFELCGPKFNALKWDPQERRYWVARINLRPET